MLIALAIHILAWEGVRAFPIPIVDRLYIPSHCNDLHHYRTIWNIIWSSTVTIFLCTWISVHPNIPHPTTPSAKISRLRETVNCFLHRLMLMMMALIAPELIIIWAMRQYLAARRLAESRTFRSCDSTKLITEVPSREMYADYGIFCRYGRLCGYERGTTGETLPE